MRTPGTHWVRSSLGPRTWIPPASNFPWVHVRFERRRRCCCCCCHYSCRILSFPQRFFFFFFFTMIAGGNREKRPQESVWWHGPFIISGETPELARAIWTAKGERGRVRSFVYIWVQRKKKKKILLPTHPLWRRHKQDRRYKKAFNDLSNAFLQRRRRRRRRRARARPARSCGQPLPTKRPRPKRRRIPCRCSLNQTATFHRLRMYSI